MRALALIAILLCAVPALGAAAAPATPPSPPPATYEVWGFRWNGKQYVKDPVHSVITADIKQAADYAAQITSFAGWSATTNLPSTAVVHTVFSGPVISSNLPTAFPAKPTFAVWAFKLTDGKWVQDPAYCWTTTDPSLAWRYAQSVNAVTGWTATTNCPPPVPEAQRIVDGGTVHGAEAYANFPLQTVDAAYEPTERRAPVLSGPMANFVQGWLSHFGVNVDLNALPTDSSGTWDNSSYVDNSSASDNSAIQNSIAIQDSINTQNMINTQDMLNTQNMINTENMVNNLQDMVNTQNAVDMQNMINAQNN